MRVLFIYILIIFCSCHGDYADLGNGYIWVERTIGKKINEDIGTFEYVIYPDIVDTVSLSVSERGHTQRNSIVQKLIF